MDTLDEIYKEFYGDVLRFLIYFAGNRADAEDLAQETFMRAYTKWSQIRYLTSIKSWLISISRNLAIDRVRTRKQLDKLHRTLRSQHVEDPPIPDEIVNASEEQRALYTAVQTLKPEYRAVIILRGIQGFSVEETARILSWSSKKVAVTFHRAIQSLRVKLNDRGGL